MRSLLTPKRSPESAYRGASLRLDRPENQVRITQRIDTRRWGPGERIVFEPYSKEIYEETFKWIDERGSEAGTTASGPKTDDEDSEVEAAIEELFLGELVFPQDDGELQATLAASYGDGTTAAVAAENRSS